MKCSFPVQFSEQESLTFHFPQGDELSRLMKRVLLSQRPECGLLRRDEQSLKPGKFLSISKLNCGRDPRVRRVVTRRRALRGLAQSIPHNLLLCKPPFVIMPFAIPHCEFNSSIPPNEFLTPKTVGRFQASGSYFKRPSVLPF